MTCNYCGFENTDDAVKCIKCGAPLEGQAFRAKTPSSNSSFGKTISDKEAPHLFENQERTFEKTVGDVNKTPDPQALDDIEKDILHPCENCGFPNPMDAVVCANCGEPLVKNAKEEIKAFENEPPTANISDTVPGHVHNPDRKFSSTIDPYRYKEPESQPFFFTPVAKEKESPGEKTDPVFREFSFEEEPVALNRANLDENNYTLTSKVQAEVFFRDGRWHIVDRSELQTTFVQAGNAVEIKDGDLILMGDRKFIFSTRKRNRMITGKPNMDE